MDLVRTYRGRPGCGCGCKGTYADPGTRASNMRLKEMARLVAAGEFEGNEGLDGEYVLASETDTRYLWVYFASRAAAEQFVGAAVVAARHR